MGLATHYGVPFHRIRQWNRRQVPVGGSRRPARAKANPWKALILEVPAGCLRTGNAKTFAQDEPDRIGRFVADGF
jgi:hypothetical protein